MSYIGREPTPVPLSTADYQDASVTAVKLAPNAAVGNIGYTPFDAAGGTISGAVDINGTSDLVNTNVVGTLDVTGPIDLTGNFIQNPASGTFTLAQDPTLALQAATKQYVDNNFQLATGSVQALTGDLTLTNASARVFEFTAVPEFTIVNLPAANTLSISNGKFVFRNEGRFPFGLRDNAGNLVGAVGPNSTATVYLYDITTAAGKWSILGDDVRPFFITNSNVLHLEQKEQSFVSAKVGGGEDQIPARLELGMVRIKLDPAGASFISDAKRVQFDNDTFQIMTSKRPHGLFDPKWYTFFLKKLN
jgi:hypothetical protein